MNVSCLFEQTILNRLSDFYNTWTVLKNYFLYPGSLANFVPLDVEMTRCVESLIMFITLKLYEILEIRSISF